MPHRNDSAVKHQARLREIHKALVDELTAIDNSGAPDGYEVANHTILQALNRAADGIEEAAMRLGWTSWS